ncbi:MAG: AAA family ATPase [Candidatus Diapherotrites archaeon]
MKLAITGSPGVGKTSVSKELGKKLKSRVLNEKEFALEQGIGQWDSKENELVVPLGKLKTALNTMLKTEESVIIEGHMLCEIALDVDFIVLIRLDPELLEERLGSKQYDTIKIQDNVFCEGIDYCKKHMSRKYPKNKIIEVQSQKSIKETMYVILKEFKERGILK